MLKSYHSNKIMALILLFSFIFVLLAVNPVSAGSSTIYVNGSSGSDLNNGFSWNTAKLTIKNATSTVSNGGTVNIANGVYSGPSNTAITINKNMTINGQSQYNTIIDGKNTAQIFHINNGSDVTLTNLTFVNGYVQKLEGGGAICNEGNLIVYDSNFMHNNANPYLDAYAIMKMPKCGGAIYNSGLLGLERCTFLNNTAANYNYNLNVLGKGGAIVNDGTLIVDSSFFINNTVTWEGGAIFNSNLSYVYNSIFMSNSAGYGGAIAGSFDTTNSVTVIGSYFLNNTAFPIGSDSVTAEGRGGAIYGTCTVENCGFMDNTATKGGAINGLGNCSIDSSYFLNNIAINNNTQNVAIVYGGAIYNSAGNLKVNNTIFTNNMATGTNIAYCYGGAVCTGARLSINNCNFTNNSVTGNNEGGAIFIADNGNGTVNSSIFTNNTAYYGGAISISNGDIIGNVNNSLFINNSAKYGGAINNNGVFTNGINNSTFINNTATNTGGAIRNIKALGNITNSNFTGNNADNGGAIYQNLYTILISDTNFTSNKATNGGAIYNDIGGISIKNSNYINNIAEYNGGAIYNSYNNILDLGGSLDVSNSNLNCNTAIQYGGAIYSKEGLLCVCKVYRSNLTNNTANIGSAIYTGTKGTQIEYNRIYGNKGTYDIYSLLGISIDYNWWGTNFQGTDPVAAGRVNKNVIHIVSPWIVLVINANPTTIQTNKNSTISAELSYSLPDGIPISFNTTLGIIKESQSSLVNKKAQIILNSGNVGGVADVSAKVDDQIVHTLITINLDNTTPTITSTNPANNAVNIARNKVITVTQ